MADLGRNDLVELLLDDECAHPGRTIPRFSVFLKLCLSLGVLPGLMLLTRPILFYFSSTRPAMSLFEAEEVLDEDSDSDGLPPTPKIVDVAEAEKKWLEDRKEKYGPNFKELHIDTTPPPSNLPDPLQPGNGYNYATHNFTQTLAEVTVRVGMPSGTRAKNVHVKFSRMALSVGLVGQEPVVAGDLHEEIMFGECIWDMQDAPDGGKVVELLLLKKNQMNWWDRVFEKDNPINTRNAKAQRATMAELKDNESRMTVEKMMYNQKQKEQGLPTIEEKEARESDVMKQFRAAHPEMDFSKAKYRR
eukprot:gnl/MRDRNA2_/MRDRNA2_78059_c0_seq1.p1 gnl/MRDRNA2_/MRDRNA2_78059_c0~~gnl/MRDRNA2_/MRDRNA2_78059_c0_seq1.p1  ORF type:complete len:303 (+),score=60.01 gnl/MRDRNA2_/MRDRNA2_78059_c0_seq1:176-1084(+)